MGGLDQYDSNSAESCACSMIQVRTLGYPEVGWIPQADEFIDSEFLKI